MAAEAAESPLSHVISRIFHLKPEHGRFPQGILPLSDISDHFPFPVTYNIGGITLNAISWNIMANATLRRKDESGRAEIIMNSLKYYIERLLHLGSDLIHILLFQEYGKWAPPLNQLSPMGLLGSEGEAPPRVDVSAWGVLHSYGNPMSCRPGLLTYYNKMALGPLGVIPYIIYNNNLRRGDGAAIPSPYLGEIPRGRDDLEKNLVLILKLPAHLNTIFVIQNTHRSRDEKLSYTKHILNYFKRGERPGRIMRWTGRPEAPDTEPPPFPTDHRVVVSIIGDFNYTPYALSGNVVAPADIQDKLHGDYAPDDQDGNSSFGNYLYKHAREEGFDDPAHAYQDIIFRSIDQYRDPNIREALFQIREGEPIATSGLVPCFSQDILSRRRKEDDILGIERLSQGRRTQPPSWRAAPTRVQQREKRRAEDGKYYTRQEFNKFYDSEAEKKWRRARGRRPGTQAIKPKNIIHKKRKRHKLNSKTRKMKRKKSLKKQKRNNRTKKRRYR
jgi:hypothetical protein